MEQTNTKTDEKNSKKTKVVLFLFIMPILFLILLAGITVIGIYLAPQDGSGETSQLIGLTTLMLIIAVISLLIGAWVIYFSIRYIEVPAWRLIASGFKGNPDYPHFLGTTKSVMAKAKSKRNKKQRACMWLGNICGFAGVILIINDVVWRWILTIKGERHLGSVPFILFGIGIFIFFAGVFIVKASIPKDTP